MQSTHPYENSTSNQLPEQSPPFNKDRFFYFPRAVFIRKFDCIFVATSLQATLNPYAAGG